MNRQALLLLVVFGVALAATLPGKSLPDDDSEETDVDNRHHRRHHFHYPPFLRNVTREARFEFFEIIHNPKLTKKQIGQQIGAWAKKYHVLDQVKDWAKKLAKQAHARKLRIDKTLKGLPDAFTKILNIVKNENLTLRQSRQQVIRVFKKLDRLTARSLAFVLISSRHSRGGEDSNDMLRDLAQLAPWETDEEGHAEVDDFLETFDEIANA